MTYKEANELILENENLKGRTIKNERENMVIDWLFIAPKNVVTPENHAITNIQHNFEGLDVQVYIRARSAMVAYVLTLEEANTLILPDSVSQ